jgi:hypothetical protein
MAVLRECEQCKKTAELGASLIAWWRIKRPESWKELDFCSWDCVRKFAAAHADASTVMKGR